MSKSDLVDISVEVQHETAKAYLLFDGIKTVWLPKSQCEIYFEPGKSAVATMPEWLAQEKGLI